MKKKLTEKQAYKLIDDIRDELPMNKDNWKDRFLKFWNASGTRRRHPNSTIKFIEKELKIARQEVLEEVEKKIEQIEIENVKTAKGTAAFYYSGYTDALEKVKGQVI